MTRAQSGPISHSDKNTLEKENKQQKNSMDTYLEKTLAAESSLSTWEASTEADRKSCDTEAFSHLVISPHKS